MPDPTIDPPALREVAQVAHRLNMSQEHVRRLLRARRLPGVYLEGRWRVERRDVEAYIARHRTAAKPGV
jgi:excisionase family DNA binding protein